MCAEPVTVAPHQRPPFRRRSTQKSVPSPSRHFSLEILVSYPSHGPRRTGAMGTANSPTFSYTSASIEEAEASHTRLPRRHRRPTRGAPCKDEEEEQPEMPALGNSAEGEAGARERGRWEGEQEGENENEEFARFHGEASSSIEHKN
ncbi:hypothetical protein K438DRAFT_1765261 [Mycena galopus ATCC 62051]|nr:hypothetical protein K438DRAFT_1765261 [Mycena galopus ATCC 62051]